MKNVCVHAYIYMLVTGVVDLKRVKDANARKYSQSLFLFIGFLLSWGVCVHAYMQLYMYIHEH